VTIIAAGKMQQLVCFIADVVKALLRVILAFGFR